MKNTTIALSLSLILAACGGGGGHSGSTGPQGAPGKSAYEIWLEQGNVGTEQDFLDSLVSGGGSTGGGGTGDNTGGEPIIPGGDVFIPKNKGEEIEHYINKGAPYYDYSKTTMAMPNGQEYNQYKYSADGIDSLTGIKYTSHYTYNEKELEFGNYIMYTIDREYEDGRTEKITNFEIMDRGIENVQKAILPTGNAVFKGTTWALVSAYGETPEVLAGEATFKSRIDGYMRHPELTLAFDNYYQIEFAHFNNSSYNIKISGENSTGKSGLDLPIGEYANMTPNYGPGGTDGFLSNVTASSKDGTEEVLSKYRAYFNHNDYNIPYTVSIDGVFGGTKQ